MRLGYRVVHVAKYPPQGTDVSAVLKQVKAANPDVLVASSYFENAVLIVRQAKQMNFCPKMLSFTLGPELPDFAKSLGKDADYIYGSSWWLPNMGWKGRDFGSSRDYANAMAKRTGREPTYLEAAGTAAGLLLQMAIEKASSLDTDAVRAALGTMDSETFWGPIARNDRGQNIKGASGPIQIQNGKIISIYPEHLREARPKYQTPCWKKR